MMTLARQLLVLLPCLVLSTYLFERLWGFGKGLNGCWFSFPAADLSGFLIALVFLRIDFKAKHKLLRERQEQALCGAATEKETV